MQNEKVVTKQQNTKWRQKNLVNKILFIFIVAFSLLIHLLLLISTLQ